MDLRATLQANAFPIKVGPCIKHPPGAHRPGEPDGGGRHLRGPGPGHPPERGGPLGRGHGALFPLRAAPGLPVLGAPPVPLLCLSALHHPAGGEEPPVHPHQLGHVPGVLDVRADRPAPGVFQPAGAGCDGGLHRRGPGPGVAPGAQDLPGQVTWGATQGHGKHPPPF